MIAPPLVSVGLPVYNGERYLAAAIESILGQTYPHLELIICDNCSTDSTPEICRRFQEADGRVRFFRNAANLGVSRNFNLTVEKATGKYFRWSADDDLLAPEYLERCVDALERDNGLVLCHCTVRVIDADGSPIEDLRYPPGYGTSASVCRRFGEVLRRDRLALDSLGLMRTELLGKTHLIENYVAADRIFCVELSLLGRFRIIPEPLFLNRDHPDRGTRAYPAHHLRAVWFDPHMAGRMVFPHWRILGEYLRTVSHARLSFFERFCCFGHVATWLFRDLNFARLGADLLLAFFPGVWRVMEKLIAA